MKNDSTIEILFDAFTNRIDFRTESEIKGYYIKPYENLSLFRARIWHADAGEPDTVSVNFGAKPFHYLIPPGYTALDRDPIVCNTLNHLNTYYLFFINMQNIIILL